MITTDKLINRIQILKDQHKALDKEIKSHYNHYTDDTKVKMDKARKLRLKSEISELQQKLSKLQS